MFSLTFEFHEHNAVTELGMAGDDDSADDDGAAVEPESGPHVDAECELDHHLDVAAATTEVGGYEANGDIAAFLVDFDLDLDRIARMPAPVGHG